MNNYFAALTTKNNCRVIPNGYDPADLPPATGEARPKPGIVEFIFAGTLYNNLDYILEPFFGALKELKAGRPDLYSVFSMSFYGRFPEAYKKYIDGLSDKVHLMGEVPYDQVCGKLRNAHFGTLFLNDIYNSSFSTKFCEYMALKKKTVVVANQGPTSDYIKKNKLGYHIEPEKIYEQLEQILEHVVKNKFLIELNEHFDQSIFSIENIVKELETYLSHPVNLKSPAQ
jgi:glycosyltransferase involved in cell wall biosynthesis